MSDKPEEQAAPVPPKAPKTPADPQITLDSFCIHYAQAAEVETMGAFRFTERQTGVLADTAANYLARLAQFKNRRIG